VPQADPFGGWVAFPAISADRLGMVRVTRGGGSAIWGSGALAGTVELDSATPDDAAPLDATLAYGSRNSLDARAGVLRGSNGGFIFASGAYARGDGFNPIIADDRGPADRRAPYRQASGFVRGVTRIGAATELQANLLAFDDRRDRGLANTANHSRGIDGSLRLVGRESRRWSLLGYFQQRRFDSQFSSVDAARATSTLVLDQYAVPSTGWGARGEVRILPSITLGADLRGVSGETRERFQFVAGQPTRKRIAGGRTLTGGGFIEASTGGGPLSAAIAARIDRWAIRDGSLVERLLAGGGTASIIYADRSGWVPTGRISVGWAANPTVRLDASAYRGWRLPTLNELYRPFRAGADATAANALLQPETMVGAEIGATLKPITQATVKLTLFAARLDDAIANVTIARGPGVFPGVGFVSAAGSFRRRENLDAITSRGIELDVDAKAGPVDLRLSYALVDAKVSDEGIGAAFDGRRPVQVPRHSLTASANWKGSKGLNAGLRARFVSAQYEDDANSRELASALTFDAHATARIDRRFRLTLRGENLFDARVEAAVSERGEVERATPRALWAEVGFSL
jgi:outer membrane receptor protein involved in Fe transport